MAIFTEVSENDVILERAPPLLKTIIWSVHHRVIYGNRCKIWY